jgi:biotin-[acetyl-CoA-carboxylase] ligase BirA-like protein
LVNQLLTPRRWWSKLGPSQLKQGSTVTDSLKPTAILDGLSTGLFGRQVVYFEATDSTNSVAKRLARAGAVEGTLVIAEHQVAGRGRLGRSWLAPAGTSLLFSLLFRPDLEVRQAQGLTMICGLGVRAAIREVTGLPAQLKWPNDITLGGRKAGGILTEVSSSGPCLEHVVAGIGLNVNMETTALPPGFNATSISHELGHTIARLPLLQAALVQVERRYSDLSEGKWPAEEWAAALETLGKSVELRTAEGIWKGVATAVDDEGALILRTDTGQLKRALVGDVVA